MHLEFGKLKYYLCTLQQYQMTCNNHVVKFRIFCHKIKDGHETHLNVPSIATIGCNSRSYTMSQHLHMPLCTTIIHKASSTHPQHILATTVIDLRSTAMGSPRVWKASFQAGPRIHALQLSQTASPQPQNLKILHQRVVLRI